MKILVAEDNEDGRRLLLKQLRGLGHHAVGVSNGQEALEEAHRNPPDLMVSDILMPEMDGFQLCMEWKLDEHLKGIPLVFYTATYTSDDDEKFALSLGADAFVRKPTEIGEFVRILSEVAGKARTGVARPSAYQGSASGYAGFLVGYSQRLLSKLCAKVAQLEADIAERERLQAESSLKAQMLDAATDIIVVAGIDDWLIRYVNEAACQSFGYSREELLGHDLRAFIAPEFVATLPPSPLSDEAMLESGHVRRDGTVVPTEVHQSITDWAGRKVRLAVVRDITERKKAEERLQEANARLERVLEGTLAVIEQIVEASDPYTSGHERRVAELAVAIAREMGLPEESCVSLIHTAAVIHDVGKTTIPAEILSKPGKLSSAEFALIKTHSRAGYDIIKRANLPDPVAEVILQHHERLDGSGYPQGLSNDDILPEAQVLAVADVVEAMSSYRPYRPALGIDAALDEVAAGSGTRYYPDVVAACVRLFREKGFAFSV